MPSKEQLKTAFPAPFPTKRIPSDRIVRLMTVEERKKGRKEGRKEGRQAGRKERRKKG